MKQKENILSICTRVSVLYFLILSTSGSLTMAETITKDEQRFDSVETLSKAKSLVESRVKLVRSLHQEQRVNEEEYQKIQLLYDEARADVNAGLDRVLVELEAAESGKERSETEVEGKEREKK